MSALTQRAHLAPATPVAGILMAMFAFAMFTGMDAAIKLLAGRYHVLQVMWLNSLFALLAVVMMAALRGRTRLLWPRHWRLQLIRWSVSYLATIDIFWSYPRLALADAYAILFTTPLLITALSAAILGEHVGWRRWAAVAVGFGGVVVILDPGHGMVAWAGLAVLAGAVGHAFNMLLVRKIGVAGGGGHRQCRQRAHPARHPDVPALGVADADPARPVARRRRRHPRRRRLPPAGQRLPIRPGRGDRTLSVQPDAVRHRSRLAAVRRMAEPAHARRRGDHRCQRALRPP
jgi:EamA-like transporter family